MAVARGATAVGATNLTGAVLNITYNQPTSDSQTWAVVGVTMSISTNAVGTCSVTYGGTAMVSQGLVNLGATTSRAAIALFTLRNPPSGSQTIAVTTGGGTRTQVHAAVQCYTGAGGVANFNSAATTGLTVTTVANGAAFCVTSNGVTTGTANQNVLYSHGTSVTGLGDFIEVQDALSAGASVAFTNTGTATTPESLGIALIPPSAATASLPGTGRLTAAVWQPTNYSSDTFTRADSTTSAGPNWTNQVAAGHMGVLSNVAYPVEAGIWIASTHNEAMGQDDVTVTVTVGNMGVATSANGAVVILGSSSDARILFFIAGNTDTGGVSGVTIYTEVEAWSLFPGAGVTARITGTPTLANGDTLIFERVGNVYTIYKNTTNSAAVTTWTDSGNVVARDAAHRQVGIGGLAGVSNNYVTLDNFIKSGTIRTASPALSGHGGLTASAVAVVTRTATFSGHGVLRADAWRRGRGSPVAPEFHTTWTGKANTSSPATTFDTGQAVSYSFAGTGALNVTSGKLTNAPSGAGAAGYLWWNGSAPVTRIGVRFTLSPVSTNGGAAALAIMNQAFVVDANLKFGAHLTLTSTAWELQTYRNDTATWHSIGIGSYSAALTQDGTTLYEAELYRTGSTVVILTPDGGIHTLTNSEIGSWSGNFAFVEVFEAVATDEIAGFTENWASNADQSSFVVAAFPGHGVLTATATTASTARTATFSGHGVLTATTSAKFTSTVALSGHGVLTATTVPKIATAPALSGHGVLTATASMYRIASTVALSGHGVLTATKYQKFAITVARTGTGILTATATAKFAVTKNFSGVGVLTATATAFSSPLVIVGTPNVGTYNGSGSMTVAIPAHAVGDLILIFAWNQSANQPQVPGAGGTVPAWSLIDSGAGTVASATYSFIATATNTTSGTWNQTIEMAAVVLRGQAGAGPPTIGGHGATETGATTANVPAPGVTLSRTDGTSVILKFFGSYVPSADWGPAPAGYTKLASGFNNGAAAICVDSKDSSTSDASVLQPIANTFGFGRGNSVEVDPGVVLRTAAFSGAGNLSATTLAKFARTAALPGHGVLTGVATMYRIAKAAPLSGVGVLTATTKPKFAVTATLSGHGVLSASATMYRIAATVSPHGTGTLSATAKAKFAVTVARTGTGLLTATATMYRIAAAASLHGTGTLTVTKYQKFALTKAFTGTGTLTATATMYRIASAASLHGTGLLTVTYFKKLPCAASLSGAGLLTVAARMYRIASSVALPGHGVLTATATAKFAAIAAKTGQGTLTSLAKATKFVLPGPFLGHGVLTAVADPFRAVALHGTGTLSATATMYRIAASATLHGTGTLSATVAAKFARSVALPGHGLLSATASMYRIASSAHPVGTGTLTAISTPKFTVAGVWSGAGTLTATVRMYSIHVTAAPSGHGVLSATYYQKFLATATVTGHGTLTATATMYQIVAPASPHGTGTLSTVSFAKYSRPTSLPGVGTLTATARLYSIHSTALLSSSGTLTADVEARFFCEAVLSGTGILSATAFGTRVALDAPLGGTGILSAVAFAKFTDSVALSGAGALSAIAVISEEVVSVELAGQGTLSAAAGLPASVALHNTGTLTATVLAVIHSSAVLGGTGTLVGLVEEVGVTSARLSGTGTLTAVAAGVSSTESLGQFDLTGHSVSVQLVSAPVAPGKSKLYLADGTRQHELAIQWRVGSLFAMADGIQVAVVAYDAAVSWQRMREAAGTLYFETSRDGIVWDNTLGSIATPGWVSAVYVGLQYFGPGIAIYDNLNVPPAYPVLHSTGTLSSITRMYAITSPGSVSGRGTLGAYVSPRLGTAGNFFAMF